MSDVSAGAVLTLVVPLALLMVVLAIWAVRFRRAEKEEITELRSPDDAG
jgi:cytochrome c-type biogenesis protein CcmH/NrfF